MKQSGVFVISLIVKLTGAAISSTGWSHSRLIALKKIRKLTTKIVRTSLLIEKSNEIEK